MKQDPTSKIFRLRYFVIIKDRCWYFEMEEKGKIDLEEGVGGHSLNVVENTERYLFFAHSLDWIQCPNSLPSFVCTLFQHPHQLCRHDLEDTVCLSLQCNGWSASVSSGCRQQGGYGPLDYLHRGKRAESTRAVSLLDRKRTIPTLPEEMQAAIAQEAPEGEVIYHFSIITITDELAM